jgi:hypothetical protein
VYKFTVVGLQLSLGSNFLPVTPALFAYNEVPTFAVAKRLLVQGASFSGRALFSCLPVLIQSLEALP